jgi:hypothetical protein
VPGGQAGALLFDLCGFAITLFAMVVAVIPPFGTVGLWLHETKLVGGSLFLYLLGLVFYWRCEEDKLSGSAAWPFPQSVET